MKEKSELKIPTRPNLRRNLNERGQMRLSFGMIFSIILMIIFIAFAFFAINKFLGMQRIAQVGQFTDGLQTDVDKMWKGSQGSREVEYSLPKKIKEVCFRDDEYGNLFFYPLDSSEGFNSIEIKHIDIEKIIENENPFCIKNIDGKVKMIVKKSFGEELVMITD